MANQSMTDETSAALSDSPAPPSAPTNKILPAPPGASSPSPWWRIGDFGILGLWIVIVSFTIQYHEKWADEAQAWLIARDLDLRTIWFHELRYEGSPGLWHTILWIAQHVFHAKYGAISYIGMAGATAGVALLIFKAPFPRIVRWPLAFTYFMVYQYAVIARPYTFLPLLAFAVAILFKDIRHPERMTIVLVLLANLSTHGTILAGCFGLAYLIEAWRSWHTLEANVRTRYYVCVSMMALTFVFIYVILKPTPDNETFAAKREVAQLSPELRARIESTPIRKVGSIISGAFLDFLLPSVLFVLLAAAFCFMRCRFLTFALPVGSMIVLYAFHGYFHHHGTATVAALAGLWIAWPTAEEQRPSRTREIWATHGMSTLLLCLCAVNIWDAWSVIERDRLYPYSGSDDAANYLKSVGADREPIFGLFYGMVAIQPYFDHNILANTPTTYFHHGLPLHGTKLDVGQLRRLNPEYVVVYSIWLNGSPSEVSELLPLGYEVVHFSDGYLLYKRSVTDRQAYYILRRMRTSGDPAPPQTPN